MAEQYKLIKSLKSFKCHMCGKQVPAKTRRIEDSRGYKTRDNYCLNCGEKLLLERKRWHKQRGALINRILRRLRSHPKDRIVQRLS